MTPAEDMLERTADYVRQLRDAVSLQIWDVTVKVVAHPGDDAANSATVESTPGRHHAVMEIAEDVAERGGPDLRQTIVHEFMHLFLRDAVDFVESTIAGQLPSSAYTVFLAGFKGHVELMVDDVATAWAGTLPLPSWGTSETEASL